MAAASLYESQSAFARGDAETLARSIGGLQGKALAARFTTLAVQAALARAALTSAGTRTLADLGDRTAIAPGAVLTQRGVSSPMTVTVSELTGLRYAHELAGPAVEIEVRQGTGILGSTLPAANRAQLSSAGNATVNGTGYRAVRQVFAGFDRRPVAVTPLGPVGYQHIAGGAAGESPWR